MKIGIGDPVTLTDGRIGRCMGFTFAKHQLGTGPFGKYPFAGAKVASLKIKINDDNPFHKPEWFHSVRTIPLDQIKDAQRF